MELVTQSAPRTPSAPWPHAPARMPSAVDLATIAMLRSSGHITERDADRLVSMPDRIDDVALLAMLHERHDLTDLEYEREKGERLRRA